MSPLKEGLGLEDPAAAGGVGGAAGLAPAGLKKKKRGSRGQRGSTAGLEQVNWHVVRGPMEVTR